MIGLLAATHASSAPAFPTAGGLSTADLLALLTLVAFFFGLLLTALGALSLRLLSAMDRRITEVDLRQSTAVRDLRVDLSADLQAVWQEVRALRSARAGDWAEPMPTSAGPVRTAGRLEREDRG